ncbi:MAG: hypothetical protein IT435_15945 [Phycisphaerales bacterium]|nr:hypothetical protein [Phycisphaerales bacterium]
MNRARLHRRLNALLIVVLVWVLWLGGGVTVGTWCGLSFGASCGLAIASPCVAVLLAAVLWPLFTR